MKKMQSALWLFHRRHWLACVLVLPLIGVAAGVAQTESGERPTVRLTLSRAIEMAMQHNRQLALAHLAAADSREKLSIAKSLYYPHVANQSSALYLTDLQGITIPAGALSFSSATGLIPSQTIRIGQGAQDAFTSGTGLVQPLTQLIKVHAGEKAAQADVKSADVVERDARNSISLLVYKLYFSILESQSELRTGEAAIAAAEGAEEENRRAVTEGRALEMASLQSHVALLDQRQSVLKTRIAVDQAMLQLDDALGLMIGTRLELDPNVADASPEIPSRTEALTLVRTRNAKVLEAEQMVEKAKAGLTAARAEYIPNITASARYSYQSGVPFLLHNFGSFGGIVSFDLFDGGAREAKIRDAKIQLEMAQTQLSSASAEAMIAVSTAYDQIDQLKDLIALAQQALEAKRESARVSRERFVENAEMASHVAKAQAEASSQETSLLQAQLSLILAQGSIRQILGEGL